MALNLPTANALLPPGIEGYFAFEDFDPGYSILGFVRVGQTDGGKVDQLSVRKSPKDEAYASVVVTHRVQAPARDGRSRGDT